MKFRLLFVAFFLATRIPAAADEMAELKDRLLTEGLKAQAAYRNQLTAGVSVLSHQELFEFSDDKKTSLGSNYGRFVFQVPCGAIEGSDANNGLAGENLTTCVNANYGVLLRRPSAESPWIVRQLATSDAKSIFYGVDQKNQLLELSELLLRERIPVLEIYTVPVERLLTDKNTIVKDVRTDDQGRVEVQFTSSISFFGYKDEYKLCEGSLWLSPDKSWAVSELNVQYDAPKNDGVIERRRFQQVVEWTSVDGKDVPQRVRRFFHKAVDEKPYREMVLEFTNWNFKPVPLERFRLGNYGLPEPGLVAVSKTTAEVVSPLLVANVIGFSLIAISFAIWRMTRR